MPNNVRGLWRRTTLDEYRKPDPRWETVLDLDQLAREEKENWVWNGAKCLYPKYDRCLLSLSRGGGDASWSANSTWHGKSFIERRLQAAGSQEPTSTGAIATRFTSATDFGPGSMTKSGYPRIVQGVEARHAAEQATHVYSKANATT